MAPTVFVCLKYELQLFLWLSSIIYFTGSIFIFVFQSRNERFEVRGRHGKSVLTISGVRLTDLGRFDCEAQSRIGGHQKSMFLDIECKYVMSTLSENMLCVLPTEQI